MTQRDLFQSMWWRRHETGQPDAIHTPRGASVPVLDLTAGGYRLMYRAMCLAYCAATAAAERHRYRAKAHAYYLAWREALRGTRLTNRSARAASTGENR